MVAGLGIGIGDAVHQNEDLVKGGTAHRNVGLHIVQTSASNIYRGKALLQRIAGIFGRPGYTALLHFVAELAVECPIDEDRVDQDDPSIKGDGVDRLRQIFHFGLCPGRKAQEEASEDVDGSAHTM